MVLNAIVPVCPKSISELYASLCGSNGVRISNLTYHIDLAHQQILPWSLYNGYPVTFSKTIQIEITKWLVSEL